MDRKSRQAITNYILAFLAALFCLSAVFFIYAEHEENTRRHQIAELIEQYPELEGDFIRIMEKGAFGHSREKSDASEEQEAVQKRLEETYGYAYTRCIRENCIWKLYGACILCISVLFGTLWLVSGRKKEMSEVSFERLKTLDMILAEFGRGNYGISDKSFSEFDIENQRKTAVSGGETEIWMKIGESLQELKLYLVDLKERSGSEEEKTKELITNISHQLKTPLASLRMSHELIDSEYLTKEERKEFLKQEEREIARLQLLLDEMIKISRLEKRMIQLKPEIKPLTDTISNAVSVIFPKAQMKKMSVQVEMEEELSALHDPHWTAEALANILDNAVKYAPAETEITIQVQKLAGHALIEIMDEGPGISDKEKHKIYQRFYRGEQGQGTEGTGVGLYLARQILEKEKGSIMVKNRYPKGSIFRIILPTH